MMAGMSNGVLCQLGTRWRTTPHRFATRKTEQAEAVSEFQVWLTHLDHDLAIAWLTVFDNKLEYVLHHIGEGIVILRFRSLP
jgi:hypothetical protein